MGQHRRADRRFDAIGLRFDKPLDAGCDHRTDPIFVDTGIS